MGPDLRLTIAVLSTDAGSFAAAASSVDASDSTGDTSFEPPSELLAVADEAAGLESSTA